MVLRRSGSETRKLVLSTELIRQFGYREEKKKMKKLTFRAVTLRLSKYEGLEIETASVFNLFTVAKLPYQLS